MDLVSSLFILLSLILGSYLYTKNKNNEEGKNEKNDNPITLIKEELNRRNKILEKVEEFIKGSKFIEPIAKWNNTIIYKYIFNAGYLYEFEEILIEKNKKIGIDESLLCFNQICYKRVHDKLLFIKKFGKDLDIDVEDINNKKIIQLM